MPKFAGNADRLRIESDMPFRDRKLPASIAEQLALTASRFPDNPAVSFQMSAEPGSAAMTLTWAALADEVDRCAALLRDLGVGPGDHVAMILPNCTEAAVALLSGMIAGVICPVNPLLEASQISALLRETGAKVVIGLAPVPGSDLAARIARSLENAPAVETLIEVDLTDHLAFPRRMIARALRPRRSPVRHVRRLGWRAGLQAQTQPGRGAESLPAEDPDRISACFHTGGTTGCPKLAHHRQSGMIYNGWLGATLLFESRDVLLCPLPLFHVFAAYPVLMSCVASGAHMVMPTPQGYRGAGVIDGFWQLVERWHASFVIAVPTAVSALLERPVDADLSSLRLVISGSAPMAREMHRRFAEATGVEIAEGYGLTEATCLVSCNPPDGEKRIGSAGLPMPYTEIRILREGREVPRGETGEICIASPGIAADSPYILCSTEGPFAGRPYLPTGDLGWMDADDYLWISGRQKDLIIRGGHNIDPVSIEMALLSHPSVAAAAAVGMPDPYSGELPYAYVELVPGGRVSREALLDHLAGLVPERAAVPRDLEILPVLPKTAIGKIYKPALRARILRQVFAGVLRQVLPEGGWKLKVLQSGQGGLVVALEVGTASRPAVAQALSHYAQPWIWTADADPASREIAGEVGELTGA